MVELMIVVETTSVEVAVMGMASRVEAVGMRSIIIEMIAVIVIVDRENPRMAIDTHRNIEILDGNETSPLTRRKHKTEFLVADIVSPGVFVIYIVESTEIVVVDLIDVFYLTIAEVEFPRHLVGEEASFTACAILAHCAKIDNLSLIHI